MNKCYVLLFLGIMASCGPPAITGWDFHNLNGSPKMVTTELYECALREGEWVKGDPNFTATKREIKFDRSGNIEFEKTYDGDLVVFDTRYFYENDAPVSAEVFDGLLNEKVIRHQYASESAFRIVRGESVDIKENQPMFRETFVWNGDRKASIERIDLAGNENDWTSYEYDTHGNLTRVSIIGPGKDTFIRSFLILDLDRHKNWIKRIEPGHYNPNFGVMEIRSITY